MPWPSRASAASLAACSPAAFSFASLASLAAFASLASFAAFASLAACCASCSCWSGAVTHGPSLNGLSGTGLAMASWGVMPMPISTAVGIAAIAIALPAGMCSRVSSGFLGAACRGPLRAPPAAFSARRSSPGTVPPFVPSAGLAPAGPSDALPAPGPAAAVTGSTPPPGPPPAGRAGSPASPLASADAFPGAQETPSAPPISPSRKPITRPPKFEMTRETRESRIAATPAKTREAGWNHKVSPSTTSSTPMISEPAPAVVARLKVREPIVRFA